MKAKHNWKAIVQELVDHGLKQAFIAKRIGIKPPSLNDILKSDNPDRDMLHANGERLLRLYKQTLGGRL